MDEVASVGDLVADVRDAVSIGYDSVTRVGVADKAYVDPVAGGRDARPTVGAPVVDVGAGDFTVRERVAAACPGDSTLRAPVVVVPDGVVDVADEVANGRGGATIAAFRGAAGAFGIGRAPDRPSVALAALRRRHVGVVFRPPLVAPKRLRRCRRPDAIGGMKERGAALAPAPERTDPMKTTPSDPSLVTFVDALTKFLDEHEPSIASTAPALTALDKKRRAKFRLGGEKAVPVIAALVTKYGLESGVLRPAVMTSRLGDAEGLVPIQKRMEALTKRLGDEIFNARSACWEETTNGYVQLARLAKKNGEIETALETVKAYFARRFKKEGAREGAEKKPSQKATVAGDAPSETNAPPHPVEA